jgi:outer membrane murein-binding lipoprotein Lpp
MSDLEPALVTPPILTGLSAGSWRREVAVSPPTNSMLQQQVAELESKLTELIDEKHTNIRRDQDRLSVEVGRLASMIEGYKHDVRRLKESTTNVSSISFSANQLVAIVVCVLALAGAFYALAGQQASMRTEMTQLTAAVENIQRGQEASRSQVEALTRIVMQGK